MPSLHTFMGTLVTFIKATYANQPDVLADFGIKPKARTPLSAEAKTAAAAKRTATRAARHTMGAKQKKSVKGAVVGITVTPVSCDRIAAAWDGEQSDGPCAKHGSDDGKQPDGPCDKHGPDARDHASLALRDNQDRGALRRESGCGAPRARIDPPSYSSG